MKAPINCPVCGDPMLNIFPPAEDLSNKVNKSCDKRLNHKIEMNVLDDKVTSLSIDIGDGMKAYWIFFPEGSDIWKACSSPGTIHILSSKESKVLNLPWVEPNLSQYTNLVKKLRTYILFS